MILMRRHTGLVVSDVHRSVGDEVVKDSPVCPSGLVGEGRLYVTMPSGEVVVKLPDALFSDGHGFDDMEWFKYFKVECHFRSR